MASAASSSSSGTDHGATTERRGIPGAQFVEDVQTYLTQSGLDVNSALAFLQERLQQYKLVEMKLLAQQRDLQATGLLQKNLDNAKSSLEVLIADLQFLRDQVTITQVTIARVYNWDVHQRRIRQAGDAAAQD